MRRTGTRTAYAGVTATTAASCPETTNPDMLQPVNLGFGVVLGLVFGALAGACAFVIAYAEYKRNWTFTGNAVGMALRSAFMAFLFFFVAGILLPWVFRLLTPNNGP